MHYNKEHLRVKCVGTLKINGYEPNNTDANALSMAKILKRTSSHTDL